MSFFKSERLSAKVRAALADIRNTIKIGFDFETDMDENAGGFDESAAEESARDSIDEYDICFYAGVEHNRDWITALGCRHDWETLAELLSVDIDQIVSDRVDSYRDNGEFCTSIDLESIAESILPTGFSWEEDGSVNGPEFQSPVCTGIDMAVGYASRLFDAINRYNGRCNDGCELEIHTTCSAHIHLQLADMHHSGANVIQQTIFDELSKRWMGLPMTVRNRISECNKYIKPTNGGTETCKYKYNPVQCHSQGTWEFRLFGNVSQTDEFESCLKIAVESIEHAYRRLLDGTHVNIDPQLWVELATESMQELIPMEYPSAIPTESTTESTPTTPTVDALLDMLI